LKERTCKHKPPTLNDFKKAISQAISDAIPTVLTIWRVAVNAQSYGTVRAREWRTLATPGTNPISIGLPYVQYVDYVYVT